MVPSVPTANVGRGHADGSIRVYDLATGQDRREFSQPHNHVTSASIPTAGSWAYPPNRPNGPGLGPGDDSVLQDPSPSTRRYGDRLECRWQSSSPSDAADYRVYVWEADSGKPLHILEGHKEVVHHVAFHPTQNLSGVTLLGQYDASLESGRREASARRRRVLRSI